MAWAMASEANVLDERSRLPDGSDAPEGLHHHDARARLSGDALRLPVLECALYCHSECSISMD